MSVRRLCAAFASVACLLAASALTPRAARAQMTTAETLTEAARLYDALEVERAVVLLRQVISPSMPFEVSNDQRVQAYTYLGASLAILGMRDSAITYFRAAIERDPFVDLDPARFTQRERAAFAGARARTLAVAARPVTPRFVDPRSDSIVFTVVSTQLALFHVDVRGAMSDSASVVLLDRESDGVRELAWNGHFADGRLVPPGRYALFLRARSAGASDSARLLFEVAHDHPPLEDSIPTPNGSGLLPERYPASAGARDLARGAGLAAIALVIPALGNHQLGDGGRGLARGAALGALAAGTAALLIRRAHPINHANVAENDRRRAEVVARNAEIARRNAEKLAGLRLVVSPAGAVP